MKSYQDFNISCEVLKSSKKYFASLIKYAREMHYRI